MFTRRRHTFRFQTVKGMSNESTKECQGDQRSGANGETFANGGRGVASRVQGIGFETNTGRHFTHFGHTTGVVADRSKDINGQTSRECGEHTKCTKSNAVHAGLPKSNKDNDGDDHDGGNGGFVSKSKTINDVGGGTGFGGTSDVTDGRVGMRSVVFGDETNQTTTPKTAANA